MFDEIVWKMSDSIKFYFQQNGKMSIETIIRKFDVFFFLIIFHLQSVIRTENLSLTHTLS